MVICQGQIHQILVELQNIFCLTGLDGEVQYSAWILLIRYMKFIITCNIFQLLVDHSQMNLILDKFHSPDDQRFGLFEKCSVFFKAITV
jgi:hypothetical protein